ncbi:MAG: DUF2179 domain-containing protein [bacterium]
MDIFSGIDPTIVNWLIMPLFIFFARIIDVSLGTIRIILVSKGIRGLAALLGFIEVFIWIIAIGQIMQNLNNFLNYFGYAAGFASGTYIGIFIENKLSIGKVLIRIITRKDATDLLEYLIIHDYHLTSMDAEGRFGDVKIIFLVLQRKDVHNLIRLINRYNPRAFYTIEDVRYVNDTIFIPKNNPFFLKLSNLRKIFTLRK